jgi:glutathione S-transferase
VAPNIVLHQWEISPFCTKVRKVLRWKGLAYKTVEYNGLLAPRAAKLSGNGKLPVLDYDGKCIQDSSDILTFLEQRHPEPALFPAEPAERATARLFEDWADESLYWYEVYLRMMYPDVRANVVALLCKDRPAWERPIFAIVFRRSLMSQLRGQGLGRQKQETVEAHLFEILASLEAMLAERQWLVGSEKSVADAAVSAQIDEMLRTSVLAPRIRSCTALMQWIGRCAA